MDAHTQHESKPPLENYEHNAWLRHERKGKGKQVIFTLPRPAAGADFVFTLDSDKHLYVLAVTGQLVTSAAIANRTVHFQFRDNAGNTLLDSPATQAQAAGATQRYNGFPAVSGSSFDNSQILPLPDDYFLFPNWIVRSLTTNIDAGDQWQNVVVSGLVWFD